MLDLVSPILYASIDTLKVTDVFKAEIKGRTVDDGDLLLGKLRLRFLFHHFLLL